MIRTSTIALVLLASHWILALVLWPGSGHPLPIEEELRGQIPTELTWWSWFSLPLGSLTLVIAVLLLARWMDRTPLFLGLRERMRFRRLEPAARERVLSAVQDALEGFSLPVATLFLLIQVGVNEAVAGRTSLPWTLGGLLLSMLWFSALAITSPRRVRKVLEEEWEGGSESSEVSPPGT